jgi:putative ABC transport system permease protein
MVSVLRRKLRRDLLGTWGQVLSIALVVASGLSVLLGSLSTHAALVRARDRFNARNQFAHVFAELKSAPASLERHLGALDGVAQVETRLHTGVLLDLPGMVEPVPGELLSLPPSQSPVLNRLTLRNGRWPEPGRHREALVNEAFAQAHRLRPGDSVAALLNGRRERLELVGTVLSPEYVYAIRPDNPMPDDRRFGVFWLPRPAMAAALGLQDAFNCVSLTLAPNGREAAVKLAVDRLLEPYGGRGATGRDQQRSHRMVMDELDQQKVMATSIPAIFFAVAAFLLHLVVSRLVATEREIIATLKALGFPAGPIVRHYLAYTLVVVALGCAAGIAFGYWQGYQMVLLYQRYFRFPELQYTLDPLLVAFGCLIFLGLAVLSVADSVRAVLALQPAEAMRPAPPPPYRPGLLDRSTVLKFFTPAGRLALRGILRRPWQTALTSLGIGLGMAVVILGLFWWDGVDRLIQLQFHQAERASATVAFKEPVNLGALGELQHLPGVLAAEGLRTVGIRLRSEQREALTALQGLPAGGRMRRLLDTGGRALPLPGQGCLLSRGLAERLQVRAGDAVRLEVLEGNRPVRTVRVAGLVGDWLGPSVYADRGWVNAMLGEGEVVNAASLHLDGSRPELLQEALKRRPRVAGLHLNGEMVSAFRRTMAEHIRILVVFLVGFAGVISGGVVYNSIRIAFSERAWELASLRVLGFTRAEVSKLLVGELAFEIFVAIPLGLLIGYGLGRLAIDRIKTESITIPFVVEPATGAWAILTILVAGCLSTLIVKRRIDRLDLVAVLKTRE